MEQYKGRSRTGAHDHPISLRERNFAPRPRAALEGVLSLLSTELERLIRQSLNEFEQALFKRAEQARNNDEQQRCFEALREVRRGRADIAPKFFLHLEAALANLAEARSAPAFSKANSDTRHELSLIASEDLELSLALMEAASKTEIRNSQALFALGQRFAVLAEAPAFEAEELPIGPHRLCECVRLASDALELAAEFRVMFFRHFDRCVFGEYAQVLDSVNRYLIDSKILPNLIASVPRHRRAEGASAAEAERAAAEQAGSRPQETARPAEPGPFGQAVPGLQRSRAAASGQVTAGEPRVAAPPRPSLDDQSGNRPATPWNMPNKVGAGMPEDLHLPGFSRPMTGWPGVPQRLPTDASNDPQGQIVFDNMRELLAGRRRALGLQPTSSPDSAHPVRRDELETVLANLQNKPMTPMFAGGKPVPRTVSHIKQDMLNQLRQFAPDGKLPSLEGEDADTIDLVGLLFDNLLKEGKQSTPVNNLMSKLQVPVLRVALRDKSFFTKRQHPARQLLNALAETGLYWLDETDEDRSLVEKMQVVVDRVVHEYQDNLDVFEDLMSDLARHMQTVVRKSDVAERRQVDALKGREKLEHARDIASKAIADRLAGKRVKTLIKTLLEQAWTDVLALTVLRHGENSEAFHRRIELVDRLIAAGSPGHESDLADNTTRVELRQEVETGLAQVGVHQEDVQSVVERLFGEGQDLGDEAASLTEVAARLKARTKFGEEGDHHAHLPVRAKLEPPLDAKELVLLGQVKGLPFGTWFEVQGAHGERSRRKLSWYSPLTGRCLFVNQRGAKLDETDIEHLVREINLGRISVVEEKSEGLLDRAFGAIMRTLKQFTGQGAAS